MLARDVDWAEPELVASGADCGILALFDSAGTVGQRARFSYLCLDPFAIVAGDDAGALDRLGRALEAYRRPRDQAVAGAFSFCGGAAGLAGYEFGAALQGVSRPDGAGAPGLFFGLYDLVVGFDRQMRTCRVFSSGLPQTGAARQRRAAARLDWACGLVRTAPLAAAAPPPLDWRADWDAATYRSRMGRVLDYIRAGDIFQANLTMRHVAPRPALYAAGAAYQALRRRNPAPFGGWLRLPGHDLCCSSPERFISIDAAGLMETRPIKGTAKRDADPACDAALAEGLRESAKDRAENVMIVDVLRNDIGRVAALGSVGVPALCALESFATVHHLVSAVTGRLAPGRTAVDLLRAALPGGSVTGAPKIRAMQIIRELEAAPRGAYCGSMAWIGFDGAMDSNIVIRSLVLTDATVVAQAGGGIVADSDPEREYAEMMLKAAPLLAGGADS